MKNAKYQHHNFDAIFLTSGRGLTFVAASVISALINLFFIGNLSHETYSIGSFRIPTGLFLCLMSITLELSKLLHVTQYNTLNELARKLEGTPSVKNIKRVATSWLLGYFLYAVLAIVSATFFSFNSIGSAQKNLNDDLTYITQDYNDASSLKAQIDSKTKELEALQLSMTDTASIDKEYTKTIRPMIDKASIADKNGWKVKGSTGELVEDPFESEWETWYASLRDNLGLREYGIRTGRDFRLKLDVTLYRKVKQQSIQASITNYEASISQMNKELSGIFESNSVSDFRSLEKAYRSVNKKSLGEGTSAVFNLVSTAIGVPASVIQGILLFFLSFLIEITIFQTSPKVQISRRMLYQFTQYLPKDFNINKFMDEVDRELVDYDIIKVTKKDEKELIKADVELEKAEKQAKTAEAKARKTRAKKVVSAEKKVEKQEIAPVEVEQKAEKPVEEEIPTVEESKNTEVKTEIPVVPEMDAKIEAVKEPVAAKAKKPRKPRAKKVNAKVTVKQEDTAIQPVQAEAPVEKPVEVPVDAETPIDITPKSLIELENATPVVSKPEAVQGTRDPVYQYRFGVASQGVKQKMQKLIERMYENATKKDELWTLNSKENLVFPEDATFTAAQVNVLLQRLKVVTYGKKFVVTEENGHFYTLFEKDALIQYVTAKIA